MVHAAIVNKDQFEGLLRGLHDDAQAVIEFGNILFFVVKRDNNGVFKHDSSIISFRFN